MTSDNCGSEQFKSSSLAILSCGFDSSFLLPRINVPLGKALKPHLSTLLHIDAGMCECNRASFLGQLLNDRQSSPNNPLSYPHYSVQCLSLCIVTILKPERNVAGQNTFNGAPVEGGQDGWMEMEIMEEVCRSQDRLSTT
ncbi:hypothetical protein CRENBAI_011350, partial [Crenichthys baileyi]